MLTGPKCCCLGLKCFNLGVSTLTDQLWGIIARGVCNQSQLQTIDDCMEAIRTELAKPTVKDWLGANVKVNVTELSATRDWRQHIPSLGVKFEGGLLKDDTGNHLFLNMLRRGVWLGETMFGSSSILGKKQWFEYG